MKLKKWLKYLDPMVKVIIFTDTSPNDTPAWEGWGFDDIPKKYKKMKIGRAEWDNNDDEPIFITHYTNIYGAVLEQVTINLLSK